MLKQKIILEACVGNYQEAKNAELKGASRIELCENLSQGGTTPSYGTIKKCSETLNIPIIVMIRPRGGNFIYSSEEIEIMHSDIEICKQLKVQGIALGILNENNELNLSEMKKISELAKPLDIVFHMAFDQLENQIKTIPQLIDLGIKRILTRGQKEGNEWNQKRVDNIKKFQEITQDKLSILIGGGITNQNWENIQKETGLQEFHGKQIVGQL